jgi:hypothetical protein
VGAEIGIRDSIPTDYIIIFKMVIPPPTRFFFFRKMNSCHLMSSPENLSGSKDLVQVESLNAVIPLGLAFKGLREAGKPWGAPGTQLC